MGIRDLPKGKKQNADWDTCKIGTIGETYTALDLMERGFEPYMPLPGRSARYDMLALDLTTDIVYPVSVKTAADEGKLAPTDRDTRRNGGIVARIRYQLPKGAVRRRSLTNVISFDQLPATVVQPKTVIDSRTEQVMRFFNSLDRREEVETKLLLAVLPDIPRSTLEHCLKKLKRENKISKPRWGSWERV